MNEIKQLAEVKDLTLVISMLTPDLAKSVSKYSSRLKFHYKDKLYSDLIDLCTKGDITETSLRITLESHNLASSIVEDSINTFRNLKNLTEADIAIIEKKVHNVVCQATLKSVIESGSSPAQIINSIKDSDVSIDNTTELDKHFNNVNMNNVNIEDALSDLGTPIYSSIDAINKNFVIKGYIKNQLIDVVAPPSCGKSLFLQNEALSFISQGYKVVYVALGDLNIIDFVTRMCAITFKVTINEATMNVGTYYKRLVELAGDKLNNLKMLFCDPDTLSAPELSDYLYRKDLVKPGSILIIDYDTNFRSDFDMYKKGEEVFNTASSLSKRGRFDLVFIASQPKVNYYDAEVIPQEGASESSRKSQIVDVMITIGRNPDSQNQCGCINLAKVRRGGRKNWFYYLLDQSGRFIHINKRSYIEVSTREDLILNPEGDTDDLLKDFENTFNAEEVKVE